MPHRIERRVHIASTHKHQAGYTFCGRLARRVDITENIHHSNCSDCQRLASREEN